MVLAKSIWPSRSMWAARTHITIPRKGNVIENFTQIYQQPLSFHLGNFLRRRVAKIANFIPMMNCNFIEASTIYFPASFDCTIQKPTASARTSSVSPEKGEGGERHSRLRDAPFGGEAMGALNNRTGSKYIDPSSSLPFKGYRLCSVNAIRRDEGFSFYSIRGP